MSTSMTDLSSQQEDRYKEFYEKWAQLRVDPIEADYIWQAGCWKWRNLERLIRAHLEPTSILEFGCGSGELLALARQGFPEAALHGIDIADRMIALAAERLGEARLTRGGEEVLENYRPRVDVALAIDILEHLVEPRRAIKALAQAGRFVACKIPLERRLLRLGFSRQKVGEEHIAGHLHFWTLAESRELLRGAGLEIIDEFTDDPPEEVRFHQAVRRQEIRYPLTPMGLLRGAHRAIEVSLERFSCAHLPGLHRLIFGSSHFVLAAARDPERQPERRPEH
jgi:SAM-dependent methyltransferase